MKAIRKILSVQSRLRNAEHVELHWSIIQYLIPEIDGNESLSPLFTVYQQKYTQEDSVFKQSSKMEGTDRLILLDKIRDDAYRVVKLAIESFSYSQDPEISAAAIALKNVMDTYKYASSKPYMENTAYIYGMIEDFVNPQNEPHVRKLDIEDIAEDLNIKNIAFERAYNERSKWMHDKRVKGKVRELRRETDLAFSELADGINALYVSNELGDKDAALKKLLGGMIDTINAYLENSERLYARRTPGYKSGGDTDPEPKPDAPFEFEAVSQIKVTSSQMKVIAPDAEAFADALYDNALSAVMDVSINSNPNLFTVVGFVFDEEDMPNGLLFNAEENKEFFEPFSGSPTGPVQLILDEEVIAVISGLFDPDMIFS